VNYFDYILMTIVGLSMVLSIWRGFVREMISLIGLVLAFFAASHISGDAGAFLNDWIQNDALANLAGFILVFVLVMVVVGLIGALIRKLVNMADLTATDRTLGVLFGATRGMLIVGLGFLIYTSYAKPDQTWMQKSMLTPYAMQWGTWIGKAIPEGYPFSTQGNSKPPSIPSAKQITQAVVQKAKDNITAADQEKMKSLLIDAIKDNKP